MSRFSDWKSSGPRWAATTLITVAALGCVAATLASDEPLEVFTLHAQAPEAADQHEARPLPGRVNPAKAPLSIFRCWQGGRLIFEGRGYGPLPSSQIAADLKAGEGATGRVQVLDMFEGLCVLELPK